MEFHLDRLIERVWYDILTNSVGGLIFGDKIFGDIIFSFGSLIFGVVSCNQAAYQRHRLPPPSLPNNQTFSFYQTGRVEGWGPCWGQCHRHWFSSQLQVELRPLKELLVMPVSAKHHPPSAQWRSGFSRWLSMKSWIFVISIAERCSQRCLTEISIPIPSIHS